MNNNLDININLEENKIYLNSKNNLENVRINIYNWNPYNNDSYNYVSEHGTINCLVPGDICLLNKPTYECHPTPEQVYESILKYI